MRIKTITCHHVYNHGAYLQTYALIEYLKSLGYDAEIINYRPYYLRGHFNLWHIEHKYKKIGLGWLYLLAKLPKRLIALNRKKVFDKFYNQYIQTTSEEYLSIDDLKANPPEADCYIAGSDQIWNTTFKNGIDAGFYLDFGKKSIKRISYAASFATDTLTIGTEKFVSDNLKHFDKISVREASGIKILDSLGYRGTEVLDPVFLFPKYFWDKFSNNKGINNKYILVYDFEKSPEIRQVAKRLAKITGLKIYSIGSHHLNYVNKNFINYDPTTFVGLIKNANYIISNSFHGTAFAMIFEKDFFVIKRIDGLNVRMRDLLSKFDLSSRIISTTVKDDELVFPIDYSKISHKINDEISKSQQFLFNALT
ncbi:MAG: polysaccharide pyruvyl transferase family protein [Muribaculaceae bacterium]|nr:polysaccharide pyruvyl transferase family protein [Muribaculaceae bacterium]